MNAAQELGKLGGQKTKNLHPNQFSEMGKQSAKKSPRPREYYVELQKKSIAAKKKKEALASERHSTAS